MKINDNIDQICNNLNKLRRTTPISQEEGRVVAGELLLIQQDLDLLTKTLLSDRTYDGNKDLLSNNWNDIIVRTNSNFRNYLKTGFPEEAIRCYVYVSHLRGKGLKMKEIAALLFTTVPRTNMVCNRSNSFAMHYANNPIYQPIIKKYQDQITSGELTVQPTT